MRWLNQLFVPLLSTLLLSACCAVKVDPPKLRSPIVCGCGYDECEVNMRALKAEDGAAYTKRGSIIHDVSDFSPGENEAYSHYQARVFNTLAYQFARIEELTAELEASRDRLSEMDEQETQLKKMHADLRLQLTTNQKKKAASEGKTLFSVYRVKKGDTLSSIALDRYGTKSAWLNIFRFNRDSLIHGPNVLEVGDQILLPKDSGEQLASDL